ncbi:MAG: phosphotransacetylase family protein [Deltaproteobacteria bacterium]|nr:phosphotransacetylase family protein [Deltaproteobacteria bacterium]MCL5791867.1 phosphotransacetylase family protein [Deltaproteobacteria bacterium]
MVPFFISSTNSYSGKTLLSIILGKILQSHHNKVGYMRIIGKSVAGTGAALYDIDTAFVRSMLGIPDPIDKMTPVVVTHDLLSSVLKGKDFDGMRLFRSAYETLSNGKDVMIISGAQNLYEGLSMKISDLIVIKSLNIQTVLIDPYRDEVCIDCILSAKELLGNRLAGVIINRVTADDIEFVGRTVVHYLEGKGIKVFGVIPREPLIESVSIRQIMDTVGGEMLSGHDKLDELIENLVVGAMDVENALKNFIKSKNKAVITGANRADIIIAALETSTKCLILTGDILPNEIVLGRAKAMGVPIMHVKYDTLTTISRIESIIGKIRVAREDQVKKGYELISKHVDTNSLFSAVGVKVK